MQPTRLQVLSRVTRRLFSTSSLRATSFSPGPAPPRLPKEEQELFEKLQQSSSGAFSSPVLTTHVKDTSASPNATSERSRPKINQSPNTEPVLTWSSDEAVSPVLAKVEATGNGEELHPDIRRGVQPEFEGVRNPKTGEIGGPKNEPLRWGGGVDWSYNGRVTDF